MQTNDDCIYASQAPCHTDCGHEAPNVFGVSALSTSKGDGTREVPCSESYPAVPSGTAEPGVLYAIQNDNGHILHKNTAEFSMDPNLEVCVPSGFTRPPSVQMGHGDTPCPDECGPIVVPNSRDANIISGIKFGGAKGVDANRHKGASRK